ncbi:MAG TPA: hypothetical protein PKK00_00365 [Bacteroidales bacterium]|nr:hypothetical protein [Bacteroidales bacterium]HPS16229.1 hypothetical protein [Bacteroidales bacterium]
MAKKTSPKKKAAPVKGKSKPAKKQTIKKPAIKKPVVKKAVKKVSKPAIKKPIAKSKPVAKKPLPKAKVKAKPAPKKVVKPAPKKKVVNKIIKKPVQIKKPAPKAPVKKVIPKKPEPVSIPKVVAKPIEKPVAKIEKKIVPEPKKPVVENKPRVVPIKLPQTPEVIYNRADMFYKNVLKADIIKRYSPKKTEDKDFLAKDINLHVKMNDKETTISEKTRDQDWNDIYVEIYKKYPDEAGWIKFTEAEYLAYFFPGRVFFCKMEPIRNLCQDILCRAVNTGIFKDMYYMFFRSSGRHSQSIKINNKTYSFTFHQTYHEDGDNSYYSIGLILPFVMLMDFRIDYKIFKQ